MTYAKINGIKGWTAFMVTESLLSLPGVAYVCSRSGGASSYSETRHTFLPEVRLKMIQIAWQLLATLIDLPFRASAMTDLSVQYSTLT